jgi:SH3 domain protein
VKKILAAMLLLATFCVQGAQTVYVTDKLEILLRSGKGTEYKILSSLRTGAVLTVLESDKNGGWTYVRTEDGKTGWVLSRFLTEAAPARVQLVKTNKTLQTLQEETKQLKDELAALKASQKDANTYNETLTKEKNQLIQEVTSIRQASSDAIQILEERNQLQERVVNLENDLQKLKRENKTLEDSTAQDWFLIGAGVLLGGILLGLILPKLSWKRKTRSWDSF